MGAGKLGRQVKSEDDWQTDASPGNLLTMTVPANGFIIQFSGFALSYWGRGRKGVASQASLTVALNIGIHPTESASGICGNSILNLHRFRKLENIGEVSLRSLAVNYQSTTFLCDFIFFISVIANNQN